MKIENISGNQPASRGYLHKSVYSYVNTATTNAKREIRGLESKVSRQQFVATIKHIDSVKKSVISNLESFIKKCHPKTYLVIEERLEAEPNLNLNNKNIKLNFGIPGASLLTLDGLYKDTEIIAPIRKNSRNYINNNDLNQLMHFSEELINVNPNSADKAILRVFTSQTENTNNNLLGRFLYRKNHKKMENFAKEIGA